MLGPVQEQFISSTIARLVQQHTKLKPEDSEKLASMLELGVKFCLKYPQMKFCIVIPKILRQNSLNSETRKVMYHHIKILGASIKKSLAQQASVKGPI